MAARLEISFRGAQTVVAVGSGETTVGRANRCTIHLPDPELAQVHFRIRARAKGYQIKDDGSGIGTRVNGKPVYAKTLEHGDVIEAGGLRCRFLLKDEPAPVRKRAPRRPEPAAPPPAEPERESEGEPRAPREAPRKRPVALYFGIGAGVVALVVAFVLLRRHSALERADTLWKQAIAVLDESRTDLPAAEEHLREGVALLEEIRDRYGNAPVAALARGRLDEAQRALAALDEIARAEREAASGIEEERADELFQQLARLKVGGHPLVVQRAAEAGDLLRLARTAHLEKTFAATHERSEALLAEKHYAEAARLWREFKAPDYLYRKRADDERAAIERQIGKEYRAVLRAAGRAPELDDRIALLEASRPVFKGTGQASDLEVRISALRARRRMASIVVLKDRKPEAKPERKPTPEDETKPPTPEEAGPYEDPPAVTELVKARAYAKAAATLLGISRHPDAKVRAEELSLLANLRADLVAAVKARPQEFTGVLLPSHGGRGDATGADEQYLSIRKDGADTRFAWEDLPAKAFPKLFRQAGFDKPVRLATAIFFDEEGLDNEARRAYVKFHASEQDPSLLTRVLARRRGIEPPAEGFVEFRHDLVTPAEKERVLLLEHIEKLGKQATITTQDKRRRAAWAELESLGAPAVETLTRVLAHRQDEVVAALKKSKAFKPQRYVARFGNELVERRKAALRFILDGKLYPYPNKSKEAQDEAERLVARVREVYEDPYPLLLAASDEAQALDAELKELDDRLAKLDPLREPIQETVAEEITKALDTRLIALDSRDQKRIDYNLAVEKYNATLETTADSEERANVTAVNAYRHMMGLYAVKIDERLVRAARKHSIEMQQLNYFAHDSPTPKLKNPGLRVRREGYGGGVSENIALGASTGVQAFWQWFGSSGHHRNMLQPGHRDLGCGSAAHHWWTQNFGSLTGNSLTPPKVPPDPDPPGQSGNGRPAPQ